MIRQAPPGKTLYLITDRTLLPPGRTLPEIVEQALLGGVRHVQLREKDLPAAELFPLAVRLRQLTREFSAMLIINDRIDVALACEADGVHLGEHSLPTAEARKLLGPDRLLGVSTHSFDAIRLATRQGADYLTFGPVHATPSKAAFGPPQGLSRLQQACQLTQTPILALGGIKQEHIAEIIGCGAAGIALISAVFSATDPQAAARALLQELSNS